MEKGVKQGKSSYPLLSMKKDQANKTNVERVYRQWPLVWEPGLNGSSIDPQLVQEWHVIVVQVVQVCIRVGAEWRQKRQSGGRWGWRQLEVGGEGEGRLYHDITPLLCHYISEWCSFSMTSEVVQGGWSGGRGGVW